jgi:hypothetical protein
MNKEELLKLVNSLNIPKSEYYILGGGSLVLFGIKEKTSDLDLCVSEALFSKLKNKYKLIEKNECGFYSISDLIEIIPNKKDDFIMDEVDGYNVEKLEKILEFKIKRNKPKDQADIENIKKYIAKTK